MKRYIRAGFYPKTDEYRGYFIDCYEDEDLYVVDIDLAGEGDEHTFSSKQEAREFIDELYAIENVNKRLGFN